MKIVEKRTERQITNCNKDENYIVLFNQKIKGKLKQKEKMEISRAREHSGRVP